MGVYKYGLEAADIAAEIPGLDASSITATTRPLSTQKLETWISDGASQLNALLDRHTIDPTADLDDNTHALVKEAVKAFAVAKALLVMNKGGEVYRAAWERWRTVFESYQNVPTNLGKEKRTRTRVRADTDGGTDEDDWNFVDFAEDVF